MRTRSALVAAVSLLLLAPVGGEARDKGKGKGKQDRPRGTEVMKEGKILVVRGLSGGEPQLNDEGNKRHLCVGPMRGELLRINDHKIRAWGTLGDKKLMTPTFRVERYEILDSGGGRKPAVGLLGREGKGKFVLVRKEGNLTIRATPAFLRQLGKRVGCKVWVVGDLEGSTLKAFKFGWLSCTTPKAIKPRKETTK